MLKVTRSTFRECGALAGALGAFAAVLSAGTFAQPPPAGGTDGAPPQPAESARSEGLERIDRHVEAIRAEEARNGPHSEALVGQLLELGRVYQERDAHAAAVRALERAWQVKRVNDGLYTLDQVPIMRRLLISEEARGNAPAARALEDELVELARRHADDPRSVPIRRDIADRRLASYVRYRNGEFPSGISISVNRGSGRDPSSNQAVASRRLRQARTSYAAAIETLLEDEQYTSDQLPELEAKLVHTFYLEATRDDVRPRRESGLYRLGRDSYERRVAYAAARSNGPEPVARALVDLADWQLLFSHNRLALESYAEAYTLLVARGAEQAVEDLFRPDTPVALPTFMPSPLASSGPIPARGHVDVRFELSKYGQGRRVEIIEATPNVTDEFTDRVTRFLSRNRFRPRLTGREQYDTGTWHVRYQLDD